MRSNLLPFGIILSNSRRPGSLWADAFRGHGLSLLAPARGMPTLPAKGGFNRPSLGYPAGSSDTCYSHRSHRPPLTRTSVVVQRYFLITTKLLISNPIPAKEIHEDSCGISGQSETPQNDSSRRLTGHPRKA